MSRSIAHKVARDLVESIGRNESYDSLKRRMGTVTSVELASPDGNRYAAEIQILWDDKPDGDIRIIAAVDGPAVSAYFPVGESEIVRRPGS
jgi:hypothetical protein